MANTMKALQTVTVGAGGATSISFTSIPQTYTDLVVKMSIRGTEAGVANQQYLSINGSTTDANFAAKLLESSGSTAYSANVTHWSGNDTNAGATASTFSNIEIYFPNYGSSSNKKSYSVDSVTENNATTAYASMAGGLYSQTAPITSIGFSPVSGNYVQYTTATLYGVFNADVSSAPSTPTIGTATVSTSGGYLDVAFTGVANAASYTITSSPSSITATGTTSPIRFETGTGGLASGTSYTFKVKANNPFGSSSESAASNSVTAINTTILAMSGTGTSGKYSQDKGVTWNTFTQPASLNSIQTIGNGAGGVYGNSRFVLTPFGTNNFYYSSTGISSWTTVATPTSSFQSSITSYTPGNGFYAQTMYDSSRTAKSTDGITWTAGGSQGATVGYAAGYVASVGRWYVSDHNNPVGHYSTTFAGTFTTNPTMSTSPYFGSSGTAASNGTTAVHAGNYFSSVDLWYSTTGINISVLSLPTAVNIGSQVYGQELGTYLIMGRSTIAYTSTNGTTWTARTTPSSLGADAMGYYSKDTGFMAIPWQSGSANCAYSNDGITWTTASVIGQATASQIIGQTPNYSKATT